MKLNNVIPRNFNKIVGKILIDTNVDIKGDILEISNNDYYRVLNRRTLKYSHANMNILRNKELFEIIEIIK